MSEKDQKAEREYNFILKETRIFGFIVSLAGVLAVIGIIFYATRQIVRPLAEITWAAREIKKGRYHVGIKHQSDDEVGVLADAFREMSEQVEQRTSELQVSNEHLQQEIVERTQAEEEITRLNTVLEHRVAERTAELVNVNEQCKIVIASQARTEKELLSSQKELRNLTAHLHIVREEERKRISREIHDELGQGLTALKMDLAWLGKKLHKDQAVLSDKTRSMAGLVESIIQTVQRISAELRPGMLDDLGLREALEWEMKEFQRRSGIKSELNIDHDLMNGCMKHCTTVFRIFQEALTNVARHSQATRVSVLLEEKNGTLTLSVRDNGRGITDKEISDPRSLGLIGMRERARLCGGEVQISGSGNEGTTLKLTLHCPERNNLDDKNTHCG